ncbi:hypothetical protein PYCCODRAFT_1424822 [Trametes coccinea BRFM310]|uniref:BTB domain-containing protein n=1 Tax=Trametes coccinea (strain BRFM310) TaxID=1353009 RepID=A0A1Y2IRU0_TRAC3|nr:hypothetical protein PYCCODRAFT_1424822 [Trametes coccinea BRFM310]
MTTTAPLALSRSPTLISPSLPADKRGMVKDPDYWFEDGNIIITATNFHPRSRPCGFRVHQGALFSHSTVLQDLLGRPLQVTDTAYNCAVVHFSESGHNLKCFLRAIYGGIGPNDDLPFADAAALVRLGHKYDVARVYTLGMGSLFPPKKPWSRLLGSGDKAIEAANLFTAIKCPPALLVALYCCTKLDVASLIGGTIRTDGFLETLDAHNMLLCLRAREMFARRRTTFFVRTITLPPQESCKTPSSCREHLRDILPTYADDVRGGFSELFLDWEKDDTICAPCRKFLARREQKFRASLRSSLPELMGVDVKSWDPSRPVVFA